MSSTGDKVKGMANEAVGNVKQGVGKATDNTKLQAEGKLQEKKVKPSKLSAKPKTPSRKVSTRRNSRLERNTRAAIQGWPFLCQNPTAIHEGRQVGYRDVKNGP